MSSSFSAGFRSAKGDISKLGDLAEKFEKNNFLLIFSSSRSIGRLRGSTDYTYADISCLCER